MEDAKPPEPSSTAGVLEPDEEDEVEQSAVYKKLYARMEAKIRRMCTPTPGSGKVSGAPELVADWKQKGYKRTQLVKLMIEADGDKAGRQRDRETQRPRERVREGERGERESERERERERCREADFQSKVESWRKTEQFKKLTTRGGWYSEQDMKKPVSEGGLAYTACFCCTRLSSWPTTHPSSEHLVCFLAS